MPRHKVLEEGEVCDVQVGVRGTVKVISLLGGFILVFQLQAHQNAVVGKQRFLPVQPRFGIRIAAQKPGVAAVYSDTWRERIPVCY